MPQKPKGDLVHDPRCDDVSESTENAKIEERVLRKRKTNVDKSPASPPKKSRTSKAKKSTGKTNRIEGVDGIVKATDNKLNKESKYKFKVKLSGQATDLQQDKKNKADHLKVKYKTKTKKRRMAKPGRKETDATECDHQEEDNVTNVDKHDKIENTDTNETDVIGHTDDTDEMATTTKKINSKEKALKTRVRKRDNPYGTDVKKENSNEDVNIKKQKKVKSRSSKSPEKSGNVNTSEENEGVRGKDAQKATARKGRTKVKQEVPSADVKTETTNVCTSLEASDGKQAPAKFVGAHVSISGGLENAVFDAQAIGAKAFAMFLKSQRQWNAKPLTEVQAAKFRDACQKHGYPPHLILPHGSYLLNCGSPNQETWQKSQDGLVDELQRCEQLGLVLFNFHPGSTCGQITVDECLDKIAECINIAHSKTKYCITVIENMSCQGNTVGGKFSELRGIIDRVKDKSRIGVCLDTCHAFAAGYDLSCEEGFQKMVAEFEETVGFQYLKGMHINDSKGKLGCHLDRHENIGKGHITKTGFRYIMEDPHFDNIPLILETPCPAEDTNKKEIKMLYSMCK